MNLSATIKQNPAVSFTVLTMGLSFAALFLSILSENDFFVIASVLVTIPTIVAFALVTFIEGRRGAAAFLRQTFHWRSALAWYVIALATGFVVLFGSNILALLTGRISTLVVASPTALFIVFFPYALLEEIGWRGFALRHLLDQHSPFVATLIAGIPWALLHVTLFLFFLPESALAKGLSILSFALLLTWIFVKSGRNVLAATVLHGALNAFGIVAPAIPEAEASWYVLDSASLVIAILILIDGRLWFTRSEGTMDGESVPSAAQYNYSVQLAWLRTLLWGVVALVVLAANWRWWTQSDEGSSTEPKPALDPVAGD